MRFDRKCGRLNIDQPITMVYRLEETEFRPGNARRANVIYSASPFDPLVAGD